MGNRQKGEFITKMVKQGSGKSCHRIINIVPMLYRFRLLILFAFISLGIILFLWLNLSNRVNVEADQHIDITPTQIRQIQDIGQWEFLSVNDEELIDTVKRGFFSDAELVRIYYGTLRFGIDLHKAHPHWIHVENDSIITARLPSIELLDSNFIDEARSRSFFEKGDWSPADRNQLYDRAYKKMLARCMTSENLKAAEENARLQFSQFLKAMGYRNVKIAITPRKDR